MAPHSMRTNQTAAQFCTAHASALTAAAVGQHHLQRGAASGGNGGQLALVWSQPQLLRVTGVPREEGVNAAGTFRGVKLTLCKRSGNMLNWR